MRSLSQAILRTCKNGEDGFRIASLAALQGYVCALCSVVACLTTNSCR